MAYKKGRGGDPLVEAIQSRALEVYEALLGPCERRAGKEQYWRTPWRPDNKPSLRVSERGFWFDDPTSEGGNVFQMWARYFGLEMPREFGTVKQEIAEALALNAFGTGWTFEGLKINRVPSPLKPLVSPPDQTGQTGWNLVGLRLKCLLLTHTHPNR